jgi:hypothetical protein
MMPLSRLCSNCSACARDEACFVCFRCISAKLSAMPALENESASIARHVHRQALDFLVSRAALVTAQWTAEQPLAGCTDLLKQRKILARRHLRRTTKMSPRLAGLMPVTIIFAMAGRFSSR